MSLSNLPLDAHVSIKDITSSSTAGRKGLTTLSESTLRRLIERGEFPEPLKLPYTRCVFWRYGDVMEWLEQTHANAQAVQS